MSAAAAAAAAAAAVVAVWCSGLPVPAKHCVGVHAALQLIVWSRNVACKPKDTFLTAQPVHDASVHGLACLGQQLTCQAWFSLGKACYG
jgi:hypothetical protein